jgi:transmembrane sensor
VFARITNESDREILSEVLKFHWEKSKGKEQEKFKGNEQGKSEDNEQQRVHNNEKEISKYQQKRTTDREQERFEGMEHPTNVDWDAKFALLIEEAGSQVKVYPMKVPRKRSGGRTWMAAASILILLLAAGHWLFDRNRSGKLAVKVAETKVAINDKLPGKNTATLTLADGSVIVLDSARDGTLTKQGNVNIVKINNSLLSFNTSGPQTTQVIYNSISTPRGGQYQIELSDGTKVWLNAASTLKFPIVFNGTERSVTLNGEAYFEVAKNEKKEFNVIVNGMRVDVLGTRFNMNAYDDEHVVTATLLQGSVKVTNQASATRQSRSVIIKPGQQANVKSSGEMSIVNDVNTEKSVAWKNGQFQFENEDISIIMRQVSRWYDVNILYEGAVPKRFFTGKISRSSNVSKVIDMLEFAGIKLKLVGPNIIVIP